MKAKGDSFGEKALLDPKGKRSASIIALERVELLIIKASDF